MRTRKGMLIMKIKTPKFIRRIICHYISKAVEEESGIQMDIEIENLVIDTKGKNYKLCMSETIVVNKKDLKQFIKERKRAK